MFPQIEVDSVAVLEAIQVALMGRTKTRRTFTSKIGVDSFLLRCSDCVCIAKLD